MLIFIRFTKKY